MLYYEKPKRSKWIMVAAIAAGIVLLAGSVLPFLPYILAK